MIVTCVCNLDRAIGPRRNRSVAGADIDDLHEPIVILDHFGFAIENDPVSVVTD